VSYRAERGWDFAASVFQVVKEEGEGSSAERSASTCAEEERGRVEDERGEEEEE